jgi:ankyrin repeat protein
MRAARLVASVALLSLTLAGAAAGAGSAVADAAQRGDRAAVQKLIASKSDVNAPQIDGATALHWAIYRDDATLTDTLIRAGASVKAANRAGVTPLAMASLYGNAALIDRLLKAGADAKEKGPNGETMAMFAARNGNPSAIKVLVEAGAEVNARETVRGTTALMWAAEQRHADAVKALLAAGADPAVRSGGAGLPRPYMANRVNTRVVDSSAERRKRAKEAGRTYEQQLDFEQSQGQDIGGQRGLGQALGPGGVPLAGRQGGATAAGPGAQGAPAGPAGAGQASPATPAQGGARAGGAGGRGRGAGAGGQGQGQAARQGGQGQAQDADDPDDTETVVAGNVGQGGGGLTALVFAAREGDMESARALLDAGADVNQTTTYGWTPLLTAVNNRNYRLGQMLIERGADVNKANNGGWTPLYLATDNRNIEGGDYPVQKADIEHLEIIRMLLDKGANPNAKIKDQTLTRTIFTMQWFFEDGATPFIRAAQSSDVELLRLLLKHGADPQAVTANRDNAMTAAGGIGWVEGVTYERSRAANLETITLLLDLKLDPNHQNVEGRSALMGAAMKGRTEVIELLVARGARVDMVDHGSRDTDKVSSAAAGKRWQALDYADGLVRVGVQSAVERPEASALLRKLMEERGMSVPPKNRTILSICVVALCDGTSPQ